MALDVSQDGSVFCAHAICTHIRSGKYGRPRRRNSRPLRRSTRSSRAINTWMLRHVFRDPDRGQRVREELLETLQLLLDAGSVAYEPDSTRYFDAVDAR